MSFCFIAFSHSLRDFSELLWGNRLYHFFSAAEYFVAFAFTVTSVYLLYLLVLVVLGLRNCARMREGYRFFAALTLSTVIILVAGVFAGGYFPSVDGASAAFVVSYGVANLVGGFCVSVGTRMYNCVSLFLRCICLSMNEPSFVSSSLTCSLSSSM